jgi:hypothetical protein
LVTPANGIAGSVVPSTTEYAWSNPSVNGITYANNGPFANESSISGTLTNTSSSSILVTYQVTPTVDVYGVNNSTTCTGADFDVVVNVLTGSPSIAVGNQVVVCSHQT